MNTVRSRHPVKIKNEESQHKFKISAESPYVITGIIWLYIERVSTLGAYRCSQMGPVRKKGENSKNTSVRILLACAGARTCMHTPLPPTPHPKGLIAEKR